MKRIKIKRWLSALWMKLCAEWAKGREIQMRIDETRNEHFTKYSHARRQL